MLPVNHWSRIWNEGHWYKQTERQIDRQTGRERWMIDVPAPWTATISADSGLLPQCVCVCVCVCAQMGQQMGVQAEPPWISSTTTIQSLNLTNTWTQSFLRQKVYLQKNKTACWICIKTKRMYTFWTGSTSAGFIQSLSLNTLISAYFPL